MFELPIDTSEYPNIVPAGGFEENGLWCYTYNPAKAVDYALHYANEDEPNEQVHHYQGQGNTNCTVFVSEVLVAGGVPLAYPGGSAAIAADLKAGKLNNSDASYTDTHFAAAANAINKAEGTRVWRVAPTMRNFLIGKGAASILHDTISYRGAYQLTDKAFIDIYTVSKELANENFGYGDLVYWPHKKWQHFAVIVGWGETYVENPTIEGIKLSSHQYWRWDGRKVPALTEQRISSTQVPCILDYGRQWGDVIHPVPFYLLSLSGSGSYIHADVEFIQVPTTWCIEPSHYVYTPYTY